jgi:hypothetical protein
MVPQNVPPGRSRRLHKGHDPYQGHAAEPDFYLMPPIPYVVDTNNSTNTKEVRTPSVETKTEQKSQSKRVSMLPEDISSFAKPTEKDCFKTNLPPLPKTCAPRQVSSSDVSFESVVAQVQEPPFFFSGMTTCRPVLPRHFSGEERRMHTDCFRLSVQANVCSPVAAVQPRVSTARTFFPDEGEDEFAQFIGEMIHPL